MVATIPFPIECRRDKPLERIRDRRGHFHLSWKFHCVVDLFAYKILGRCLKGRANSAFSELFREAVQKEGYTNYTNCYHLRTASGSVNLGSERVFYNASLEINRFRNTFIISKASK